MKNILKFFTVHTAEYIVLILLWLLNALMNSYLSQRIIDQTSYL